MVNPRKLIDSIWESVRGQSKAHDNLLKSCGVIATLGIPIIFGLITSYRSEWFENNDNLFWAAIVVLALLQILFGSFVIFSTRSTYDILINSNEIYKLYEENENTIELLDVDLKLQTFLAQYSQRWIEQIPFFADNIKKDPKNLIDSLNDIFSVVTDDENSIFLLKPREHIKFVLYMHDKERNELVPIWKQETTSGKKILSNKSRIWKPCEGHVGLTFAKGETICTEDATNQNMIDMFSAPAEKFLESDMEVYKSFSSATLKSNSAGKIGVLVATSNCIGRFQPSTFALFVNLAAAVVSSILHDQRIDDIIASNIKV